MAFCKFSVDSLTKNSTLVDNKFIECYLPQAPELCVKVYMLGLFRCQSENSINTLENFAKTLNITTEEVEDCFYYWQEQGLVTVLNVEPIEVRYLPVHSKNIDMKKIAKSKYQSFNKQMQEIIDGRMITPTEYAEYYNFLESMNVEPDALIMIAKYCTNLKGSAVGYSYILTVAKNWAYQNIKTANDVEEKLKEHELILSDLSELLKQLGLKKQPDFEDKQDYIKLTKDLGFSNEIIMFVAKTFKKKGSMEKLTKKLEKYYELKLLSLAEIEQYEQNKQDLMESAKQITKSLGLFYGNLENVIETYIIKWQNMGYSFEAMQILANFCFKNNIRSLEAMNENVEKFYSLGLISTESIDEYFNSVIKTDEKIKHLLTLCGLSRQVTSWDRDFYRTWVYTWNFNDEIIEYATTFAQGKSHPFAYINKILSAWYKDGVDTLEKAKKQKIKVEETEEKHETFVHSYSQEQINALFDNINEVKWK